MALVCFFGFFGMVFLLGAVLMANDNAPGPGYLVGLCGLFFAFMAGYGCFFETRDAAIQTLELISARERCMNCGDSVWPVRDILVDRYAQPHKDCTEKP